MGKISPNRTIVELKLEDKLLAILSDMAPNRTIVELKLTILRCMLYPFRFS